MLKQIREFHSSTATKILYGLIAASFVIWGVGSVGDDTITTVAEVRGTRITRTDLERETAMLQRQYEQLLRGMPMPPNLRAQALDNLVEAALLTHEVDQLGLDVSDDEVVAAITKIPQLQENGRFSRDLLARVLESQRDRGEFEESIRRDLREQRVRTLIGDGVQVTDADVEERYKLDHEQVSLAVARISAADLAANASVTDADLEAELAAHPERYRTPVTVRARYVAYGRAEFETLAAPKEEQVRALYQDRLEDRFTDVEEVRARHILVRVPPSGDEATKTKARTDADALLKRVRGGEDFATVAKEKSEDTGTAPKGGDLGFFGRGRMVPAFDAAAFALEPGAVSDLVESPFGLHIIKVEEKKAAGPRPYEAVREQIVKELTAERALELAGLQAEADQRAVVSGKSLEAAVGARTVQETPPFSAGADVPGVGRVKEFVDAALNLEEGQVSDLIHTDDAIYMLTPFERKEPAVPPLDQIRERVTTDAKRAAGERKAQEQAEKLLVRARELGLEKAGAETGVTLDETGPFDRRTGTIPKLGANNELRTDAFALTTASPLGPRVYTVAGDAVVVALKIRTPADMKDFATAKDGLRDGILAQRRQVAVTTFMNHLKERAARDGALQVNGDALERG